MFYSNKTHLRVILKRWDESGNLVFESVKVEKPDCWDKTQPFELSDGREFWYR